MSNTKETGNEPKSAIKRKCGRPRKNTLNTCYTSIYNDDPTWSPNDAVKLRRLQKVNRLRLRAKTKSGRLRFDDIYDPTNAHQVPTRSQNRRKLGRRTTYKNNQEATLYDSDETSEPHLSDEASIEDPSLDCDTTVQVKKRNSNEGFKEIPSPQSPKHPRTQIFKCGDCDAHFLTVHGRESHIFRKSHDTELTTCEKCNLKFVSRTLKKHMIIHHQRLKLSRENFEVLTKGEIKKSPIKEKATLRVRLFKCNKCDAHYLIRNSLKNHVQRLRHNEKLAFCEICDIKFPPLTLSKHKAHHDRLGLRRENFKIVKFRSPCIYTYFTKKSQNDTNGGNSDYSDQIDIDYPDNNRRENKSASMTIKQNKEAISRAYLFKCEDCDTHYLSQCALQAHVRKKRHDNELFPCDICNIKFPIITLNRHIEIHHNSLGLRRENFEIVVGLQRTSMPNVTAMANKSIEKHLHNTSESDSDLSQIDLENAQSKATAVDRNHLTTRCPKKYLSKENVVYKCVTCDLHFLKEKALYQHIKLKCGIKPHGAKSRRCPVCKLIFSDVNRHIVLQHMKQKLALKDLKIITIGTNKTSNITKHNTGAILRIKQKAPGILYQCRGCQNHFVSEQTATVHQNVCSPRDESCGMPCRDCGRAFYQDELRPHRIRDHKNVGAKFNVVRISRAQLFKCEHCEMHFMQKCYLVRHCKKDIPHMNQVLSECDICKIKFTPLSLEKHFEVHHDRLGLQPEDIDIIVGLNASVPVPIKTKERDHMSASGMDSSDEIAIENAGTRQLNTTTKRPRHATPRSMLNKVKLYKCKHCDVHFTDTGKVYKHLKTCNRLPSTAAVCSVCKFSFFRDSLSNHFRIHHEVQKLDRKDFTIVTCGKRKCLDEKVQHNQLENETKETRTKSLNDICVPKHMRCRVVIENAMIKNIDRYIKVKTLHSNVNKTSEPVYPLLEDGNPMTPHNGVSDSVTVGDVYGGQSIKTKLNDEDIAVNRLDNGSKNDVNVDNEGVYKDGIHDIKDEVDKDESKKCENDISDNNVPEVQIFKVEHSDSVLLSDVPNSQDTFDSRSTTAENNDDFLKIKEVFSIAPLETQNEQLVSESNDC